MKTYFSPSRKGLFNLPVGDDSVELDEVVVQAIHEQLAEGRLLEADAEGNPITVEAPAREVFDPEADYRARPITERLNIRLNRLNHDYDEGVAVLNRGYPRYETQTWTLQVTEAREYQKWIDGGRQGDAPEVPFLTLLDDGRTAQGVGDGLEDLVMRVLINDSDYSPALATFTALRHSTEKQLITAAEAEDDVAFEAVSWNFDVSMLGA